MLMRGMLMRGMLMRGAWRVASKHEGAWAGRHCDSQYDKSQHYESRMARGRKPLSARVDRVLRQPSRGLSGSLGGFVGRALRVALELRTAGRLGLAAPLGVPPLLLELTKLL